MKSGTKKTISLCLMLCFIAFFAQASDTFTIKQITPDSTVYIIIAERNDSLYKIVTPKEETMANHAGLEKLKVGKEYDLQLESVTELIKTNFPWMTNYLHVTHGFWGTNVSFDGFWDMYTCDYLDGLWVSPDPVRPKIEEKSAMELITLNVRSGSYRVNAKEIEQKFIEIHLST